MQQLIFYVVPLYYYVEALVCLILWFGYLFTYTLVWEIDFYRPPNSFNFSDL